METHRELQPGLGVQTGVNGVLGVRRQHPRKRVVLADPVNPALSPAGPGVEAAFEFV